MNRRGIARSVFALLIGLPLLVAALLFAAIYTETGSRWMVAQALKSAPDLVRIGAFRGRLWDQFELADVHFDATPVAARIDSISVHWRPRSLLEGALTVESTVLDGVDLTITPATSGSEAPTPTALPAPPLPVELRRLDLRRVSIHTAGRDIVIEHLGLGAVWNAAQFALKDFEVEAHGHRLGAAGTVAVGHEPKIAANADWIGALGGEPGQASLQVTGPLNELAFESTIDAQVSAQVSGNVRPLADLPSLSLHGDVAALDLGKDVTLGKTRVDIVGTFGSLALSIAADASTPQTGAYALSLDTQIALLGATDDAITADINWRAKPARANSEDIVGSGSVRYDGKAVRIDHATAAPYRTRIAGDVELEHDEPLLDLELGWNDISYPVADTQAIIAREGTVKINGPLTDLNIEIVSEFDVPPVGRTDVSGRLQFTEQRLNVQQVNIAMLSGDVQTNGEINLEGDVGGNFHFSGRDIDLSAINADTPSRLGFGGSAQFLTTAQGITSRIELSKLSGYLRGHALSGEASLRTKPGELTVERVRLSAGSNRINLRATWAQHMSGEFDLQIEDMAVFDPRLTGTLSGRGTFAGEPTLPQISAQFTGGALRFDRFAAASLNADIDVDMVRETESRADLNIGAISIDGKAIGDLAFAGSGNARAHTLKLGLDSGPLKLQAAASGTLGEHNWQGRLSRLELDSDIAGIWSLAAPSEITLAADTVSLSEACLVSEAARACIAGDHQPEGSSARIRLAGLPLALADRYLPATVRLRGATDAAIDLKAADGGVTGSGNVRLTNGIIERDAGGTDVDKLAIHAFAVDFDLLPQSIRAEANADIEQWFTLHGTISTARTPGGAVSAALDARSEDIGWIAEFVPELSGSTGVLELTSKLSGTIEEPQGHAQLKLKSGALRVPDVGLELTKIEASLGGDPRSIAVDAALGAGDGTLALNGNVSLDDEKQWRYDLRLDGANFPLVRIPEAEADISPQLHLAGDAKTLDVTGTLLVPRVLIDVKSLPNSAISVSEDQVIVAADGSTGDGQRKGSFVTDSLSGEVAIRFGDDISINGFGLTSKLSGDLQWSKQRGSARGRANGAIQIDKGVFRAYGQHMEIENGRIQFAGPIDNPGLSLQATRPGLPVKAGVNVTGTVRKPEISLFSEPPLSDGNTLSYIVTGRDLGGASAGDAAVLTQAALSLGAEQSATVTNQIRNTFGLDELSVAAGDTVEGTSLIAGKRLSPKLSVRSGFNPFDQLWSFFVNYKLTQRWSVEAESGERQGADLLYSIERERLFDGLPFR